MVIPDFSSRNRLEIKGHPGSPDCKTFQHVLPWVYPGVSVQQDTPDTSSIRSWLGVSKVSKVSKVRLSKVPKPSQFWSPPRIFQNFSLFTLLWKSSHSSEEPQLNDLYSRPSRPTVHALYQLLTIIISYITVTSLQFNSMEPIKV